MGQISPRSRHSIFSLSIILYTFSFCCFFSILAQGFYFLIKKICPPNAFLKSLQRVLEPLVRGKLVTSLLISRFDPKGNEDQWGSFVLKPIFLGKFLNLYLLRPKSMRLSKYYKIRGGLFSFHKQIPLP